MGLEQNGWCLVERRRTDIGLFEWALRSQPGNNSRKMKRQLIHDEICGTGWPYTGCLGRECKEEARRLEEIEIAREWKYGTSKDGWVGMD